MALAETTPANGAVGTSLSRRIAGGLLFIAGCQLVGITGALVTNPRSDWYLGLTKPFFQPPSWVFGPVWTLLYAMMGWAAWRVFELRAEPGAKSALVLFAVQLVLNGIWSPTFFGAQALGLALVVLGLLWCALLATLVQFYRVRPGCGLLLVPYQLWVSFAFVLNASLWWLNR